MNEKIEQAFLNPLIVTMHKDWPMQAHHLKTMEDERFKGDILDIGSGCCEFAIVAKLKKPEINLTVLDFNWFYIILGAHLAAKAGVKINSFVGSIIDEPFEENSFDTVNMSHVLEHVEDLDKTLKWVKKILRPGGTLFIAVPYMGHHDSPEHVHYFSEKDDSIAGTFYHGERKCENIVTLLSNYGFSGNVLIHNGYQLDKRHCFPENKGFDMLIVANDGDKK